MPSSNSTGTQAATIGVEHTLVNITSPGTYVLVVNTTNMVNGDVVELRCKSKVVSAGSEVQDWGVLYEHIQADPNKKSIPVPSIDSLTFTLKQSAGTGRNFEWNVYAL